MFVLEDQARVLFSVLGVFSWIVFQSTIQTLFNLVSCSDCLVLSVFPLRRVAGGLFWSKMQASSL